jgi:hypothetical protein
VHIDWKTSGKVTDCWLIEILGCNRLYRAIFSPGKAPKTNHVYFQRCNQGVRREVGGKVPLFETEGWKTISRSGWTDGKLLYSSPSSPSTPQTLHHLFFLSRHECLAKAITPAVRIRHFFAKSFSAVTFFQGPKTVFCIMLWYFIP